MPGINDFFANRANTMDVQPGVDIRNDDLPDGGFEAFLGRHAREATPAPRKAHPKKAASKPPRSRDAAEHRVAATTRPFPAWRIAVEAWLTDNPHAALKRGAAAMRAMGYTNVTRKMVAKVKQSMEADRLPADGARRLPATKQQRTSGAVTCKPTRRAEAKRCASCGVQVGLNGHCRCS